MICNYLSREVEQDHRTPTSRSTLAVSCTSHCMRASRETFAGMGQAYSAGIPAAVVAQAYGQSLVEDITGQVIQVKES